jgi:general stress protein 26
MNLFRKIFFIVNIILLLTSFKTFGQHTELKDSLDIKLLNVARAIMTTTKTCALITLDDENRPMVRIMNPFLPESDFTVWLGTNPESRKVDQIKKNPKVTLYYLENDGLGYVVVHGIAQLVDDEGEKEKRWKAEWKAFYPNKPKGYLLIKVSPESIEVLSYAHGIVGDPKTWQPPLIHFD